MALATTLMGSTGSIFTRSVAYKVALFVRTQGKWPVDAKSVLGCCWRSCRILTCSWRLCGYLHEAARCWTRKEGLHEQWGSVAVLKICITCHLHLHASQN